MSKTSIEITQSQLKKILGTVVMEQQIARQAPPQQVTQTAPQPQAVQMFKNKAGTPYKLPTIKNQADLDKFNLATASVMQIYNLLKQCGFQTSSGELDKQAQNYKNAVATQTGEAAKTLANDPFVKFLVFVPRTILDMSAQANHTGRNVLMLKDNYMNRLQRMYGGNFTRDMKIYLEDKGNSVEQFFNAVARLVDVQRKASQQPTA